MFKRQNMPPSKQNKVFIISLVYLEGSISEVGLQPRDLINLVFLIEKKYGIKFTEEELLDENFDCVERIVAIVSSHQI